MRIVFGLGLDLVCFSISNYEVLFWGKLFIARVPLFLPTFFSVTFHLRFEFFNINFFPSRCHFVWPLRLLKVQVQGRV